MAPRPPSHLLMTSYTHIARGPGSPVGWRERSDGHAPQLRGASVATRGYGSVYAGTGRADRANPRVRQLALRVHTAGQRTYELLRPVVLFGHSPAECAAETGTAVRTLCRQVARFERLNRSLDGHYRRWHGTAQSAQADFVAAGLLARGFNPWAPHIGHALPTRAAV